MLYRELLISVIFLMIAAITACAGPVTQVSRLGFSIQVGAFSEIANAERLTARLQDKGIDAFYFKRDNGLYAVRFGDYSRHSEAVKEARKLVSERVITTYFIADPQKVKFEALKHHDTEREPARKTVKTDDMGYIAARTAERFVGIPYRWGGNTVVDGMDCSGFAKAVYHLCGVNIPRTSKEQYSVGEHIERDDLQDGDLVFFGDSGGRITHVGIYVGNSRFVHAPKRGEDIRVSAITDKGFSNRFMGGRRYFNQE